MRATLSAFLLLLGTPASAQDPVAVPVGAARIDVTPEHPTLLAGYGSRTTEHEGVDSLLFARALAIGDEEPVVLVSVDNAGVPAAVVAEVEERVRRERGLHPDRLVVCATHTHCAPTLTGYAPILWAGRATGEQEARVAQYTERLIESLVDVTSRALDARAPASLAWGQGRAEFGGNRRVLQDGAWRGFGFQRDGPVDHSLPLLLARDPEGAVVALWFTYACHCTTLGARNRICGDWAGFASAGLERDHPGAVALCTVGCGADVGPQPAGSLELAREHGATLAGEVTRLLDTELAPLGPPTGVRSEVVDLPLASRPDREHWEGLADGGGFDAAHARMMLETLRRDGRLPGSVPLPVTTWRFEDDLAVVFLGGEVVVDYAVRLKTELDWTRLWINAWADDVPGYVPSRRVLAEGGYEADFSQVYYGQPTRYDPALEDRLVEAVLRQVGRRFERPHDQPAPDFLSYPDGATLFERRLPTWLASLPDEGRAILAEATRFADVSREGFAGVIETDGEQSAWYDHFGELSERHVLRQLVAGDSIRWETDMMKGFTSAFVFLGGLGWESEPHTAGFEVLVDDRQLLVFDVTREPMRWISPRGDARLYYVPTWTSDLDSGGIFWLVFDEEVLRSGRRPVAVRSLGDGSKRWFALDSRGAKGLEAMLVDALSH